MSERVLIFGADGQLAQAIDATMPQGFIGKGYSRQDADITHHGAVEITMDEFKPTLVINGAAYNAVDAAEGTGLEDAFRINSIAVGVIARACRIRGVKFVHFSTDQVFDGRKNSPYDEDDRAVPLGVYGASKLAGEHLVLAADPGNLVIRVCRLFGPTANSIQGTPLKPFGNFPRLMLRLGRERGKVRVVNDQIGTPTYTLDLAKAVWELVSKSDGGIYHLSNEGAVSYSDYASEIFRLSGVECEVEAVTSAAYGAAAKRPLYTVMSNRKAYTDGVSRLRPWKDALAEYLKNS